MNCRKCGSQNYLKNGFLNNKQKYKCNTCKSQFVAKTTKGKPKTLKVLAYFM